jgi:hypothetical protein
MEEKAKLVRSQRVDALTEGIRTTLDTLHVGYLTIFAFQDHSPAALALFADVWGEYEEAVQGLEGYWPNHPFISFVGRRVQRDTLRVISEGLEATGWSDLHGVFYRPWYNRATRREKVREALRSSLRTGLLSPQVRRWAGNTGLKLQADLSPVYRDLAISPSIASERCFAGDLSWCWEAVGVTTSDSPWWERLYTPNQRRSIVRTVPENRFDEDLRVHRQRCLTGVSEEACGILFQEHNALKDRWRWVPLRGGSRASLMDFALLQGGEGAIFRLTRPDQPMFLSDLDAWDTDPVGASSLFKERLAAASGLPPDTLMARWREAVLISEGELGIDVRAYSGGTIPKIGWAAVFWFLLLSGLAARSTRWRLG